MHNKINMPKLCKRGYESAKKVGTAHGGYPSAWSNTYGRRVCDGVEPDIHGYKYKGDVKPANAKKTTSSNWDAVTKSITKKKTNAKTVPKKYKIPEAVKKEARKGLLMRKNGYSGGTSTGTNRARQLINQEELSISTIRTMRNWYARHGPNDTNRGTSYPGYLKWKKSGSPTSPNSAKKDEYRGAVAYLIWGGQAAHNWISSPQIQNALNKAYPDKDNKLKK